MHAVVVRVSISDVETAQKGLEEVVVPRVSQAPVSLPATGLGLTTEATGNRCSCSSPMLVFESEDAARTVAERLGADVPERATLESAEVREVVASA
jgi:hypothetical protein